MLNWDYWKSSLCRWQLKTFRLLCCYTVKHVHRGVSLDRIAFICRVLLDCLTLETEGTMQLVPGVRGAIRLTRYKPEDSGFNPHCGYWDFSFTYSLRTHCDSGIDSEKSTSNICWGKGGRCCRADNLPNFMCQLSRTSGSLNFPEPQKFGVTLHM